ncbi:glycoside hydrolase family 15 protein, partial [Chlamydiales bacterium]|nr:glycoside hydrolase family 15 protein [Chlamydiales bacterium]
SIDFMCFPNFDSPTIFGALLDSQKGGRFQIAPVQKGVTTKQLYRPDSNILLTRFLGGCGIAEISDFMTISSDNHQSLVRRAKSVRGDVHFKMILDPRFDYGRVGHTIDAYEEEILFIPKRADLPTLRLRSSIPLKVIDGIAIEEFTVKEGDSVMFVLEEASEHTVSPSGHPEFHSKAFKETLNFWHQWVGATHYQGRWREIVNRSALTLKMLTSKKHGSIVAAPTFGLPEEIGGGRNWDYRFTWIRDASFTLYGLIRLGYTEEAGNFMNWIEKRCADLNPDGSLQIMYALDGHKILTEETLDHWEGYKGSKPVRIGNAAYEQKQLDIYGELMDSVYLYNKYGQPISIDLWENLTRLINWVCENWHQEDAGIWEIRGGPQKFLYSRVMCWVALDRGIRLARKRSFPCPLQKWFEMRDTIYHSILKDFWDKDLKAFVQYEGAKTLDASSLLMPLMKFISPTDPRWLSTLREIEKDLVTDSLVFRYKTVGGGANLDGLEGEEGTFNMCSFWYVECLARSGDVKKARFYFEKLIGFSNSLGLYSEEMGFDGKQLGNFPQAFTHLALISAAVNLDHSLNIKHINW